MECDYCLWDVIIACGMSLLLVECYYCLWNVTIACGMLLLLVECYDSLWNDTIACGVLLSKFNVRDAAGSLRSHLLARFARTSWWLVYENYENLGESRKILENLRNL